MSGRGGCFKRRSPAANQAALVGSQREAEPRRAEPRAVPCAPAPGHTAANNTGTCGPAATFRGAAAPCPAPPPPRPAPPPSLASFFSPATLVLFFFIIIFFSFPSFFPFFF